jgi:hypothetical protein
MDDGLDQVEQIEEFLDKVRNGAAELTAALAVDWTPLKLRQYKRDPDFLALLRDAYECYLDGVETTVQERALLGNRWAVEMVLYNKRPQFWRPPAHKIAIERTDTVTHEVVLTAVGTVREILQDPGAIAALQRGAIEASVRDDDDH